MAALAVVTLSSCSGPASSAPAPSVPTPAGSATLTRVAQTAAAQRVVDQVLAAARAGNRTAYATWLSPRDPVFADRARQLFDNLAGLPLDRLQARLLPDRRPLTPERQLVLGADAWVQAATVTWRLTGDTAAAEHQVWFTFVPAGAGVQLAGLVDRPADGPPVQQPGWWLGPVQAGRRGRVTVVVGAGQSVGTWLGRSVQALTEVRRHLPGSAGGPADPSLVVEVPATTADFERVVGAAAGSYADVAAVTLAQGSTPRAALRVVVNPDAARRLTPDGLGVTLSHETVHVLTRSPESPAPLWAVEGLADYVALLAYPQAGPGVAAPLLREVAEHGPPAALPADSAFAAGADRLDLTYAEAWFGCRYVAARGSSDQLGRFYHQLDTGRTLDQAATDVLGVSGAELATGWRAFLRGQARDR